MRLLDSLKEEERGTVAVTVGLMLTALVGFSALGTDVGKLFMERQALSNIADAAALSGAQLLPKNPGGAREVVKLYLEKNGVDPSKAEIYITGNDRQIEIRLNKLVGLTFAKAIGHADQLVSDGSVARTENISGYYGAAPLGVPRGNWQIGEQVSLKVGDHIEVAPGNYQGLALGQGGASTYEQNLMTGYNDWIRYDQWVATEPGNMAGPTIRGVNYRIDLDATATHTSVHRLSPRLVVVPILEDFTVNGKGEVHVVGFGMFFLEAALDQGADRGEVIGRFLQFIAEGESSTLAPDFGLYATKLSK